MQELQNGLALMERAKNFENLQCVDGKTYSLSSFEDARILVIIFFGNACPTAKSTEERIISIQEHYQKAGVQIVLINSNNPFLSPQDTLHEMEKRAREKKYDFPYLKDDAGQVARSFGAFNTPHVFVFDRERKLRYKGRVDNAREAKRVTSNDLRNVLDDLLNDRAIAQGETSPFGCSIVW